MSTVIYKYFLIKICHVIFIEPNDILKQLNTEIPVPVCEDNAAVYQGIVVKMK